MASSTGIQIALPAAQGLELSLTRRLSQAEFETFCAENPDLRVEREADGKILIMPPVHLDSGFFEGELFGELRNFSKRDGRGLAFSPSTGFRLPDGSTRSPDASWVSHEQLNKLSPAERKSFAPVVPEFVAGIRSDSDHLAHLKRKMAEVWIANGVQLAWLIDPREKKSYVYHPEGSIEVVEGLETSLTGDPVLPGFVFDLRLLSVH